MTVRTIEKSIDIHASREQVWHALLDLDSYAIWAAEFSEDKNPAVAETDWRVGSKAIFRDSKSDFGMIGKITENIPHEILTVEYYGFLQRGVEDYESEEVKSYVGAKETYRLSDKGDGITHLSIEAPMFEEYFDMMSEAWERALVRVKELSEKK